MKRYLYCLVVIFMLFGVVMGKGYALGSGGGSAGGGSGSTGQISSFWSGVSQQLSSITGVNTNGIFPSFSNISEIPDTESYSVTEEVKFHSNVEMYDLNFTVENHSEGQYIWGFLVGLTGVTVDNINQLIPYPGSELPVSQEQHPYWRAWILPVESDDIEDLSVFLSDLQEAAGINLGLTSPEFIELLNQVYENYSFVFVSTFDFWAYIAGEISELAPICPSEVSSGFGIMSPFYLPPSSPAVYFTTNSPNSLDGAGVSKNETKHKSPNQPAAPVPEPISCVGFAMGILGVLGLRKKQR